MDNVHSYRHQFPHQYSQYLCVFRIVYQEEEPVLFHRSGSVIQLLIAIEIETTQFVAKPEETPTCMSGHEIGPKMDKTGLPINVSFWSHHKNMMLRFSYFMMNRTGESTKIHYSSLLKYDVTIVTCCFTVVENDCKLDFISR